jgi:predicted DNA-binding protein
MAKKLITIYLDLEQLEKLNQLSAKTGVTKSVYIREAFDLVLKKYDKQLKSRS